MAFIIGGTEEDYASLRSFINMAVVKGLEEFDWPKVEEVTTVEDQVVNGDISNKTRESNNEKDDLKISKKEIIRKVPFSGKSKL